MKRYVLTGTPGSGKTAILRQLELDGFSVVEEAATDVIALCQAHGAAEPWKNISFIDKVADLQKQRQMRAARESAELQFHDRSAVCTAALAKYLGFPITDILGKELQRIRAEKIFQTPVFFIRNLGFISPTEARRISFEESLRFEEIHEETYRGFGFDLISVEPASLADRIAAIRNVVERNENC
jgi:predicted ATPase